MRAVLVSIQPKWCAKIAKGDKTLEIRKTKPKIETPFKVYIYSTLPPRDEMFGHNGIYEYANELIRLQSGEIVYDYGMRLCCDPENRPYSKDNFLCKKVIGEFICDKIFDICIAVSKPDVLPGIPFPWTGLTDKEIIQYLGNGKTGYGWHISELKIYDKPKDLSELYKPGTLSNSDFEFQLYDGSGDPTRRSYTSYLLTRKIRRPPQSWCYVEELNV